MRLLPLSLTAILRWQLRLIKRHRGIASIRSELFLVSFLRYPFGTKWMTGHASTEPREIYPTVSEPPRHYQLRAVLFAIESQPDHK